MYKIRAKDKRSAPSVKKKKKKKRAPQLKIILINFFKKYFFFPFHFQNIKVLLTTELQPKNVLFCKHFGTNK